MYYCDYGIHYNGWIYIQVIYISKGTIVVLHCITSVDEIPLHGLPSVNNTVKIPFLSAPVQWKQPYNYTNSIFFNIFSYYIFFTQKDKYIAFICLKHHP